MASDKQLDPEMKGWLYKWTNYLKGYQKRWFVLANGLLSYYRFDILFLEGVPNSLIYNNN